MAKSAIAAFHRFSSKNLMGKKLWGMGFSDLILLIIFIAGAFLSYGSILPNFFLSDDFGFVSHLSEKCPDSLIECLRRFGGALFFRPLTSLSFYLDYNIWQLSAIGYHGTNILLHGINGYLVFKLAKLLVIQLFGEADFDLESNQSEGNLIDQPLINSLQNYSSPTYSPSSLPSSLPSKLSGLSIWRDRLPIVAGILFLILPSHGEAVTWISARSDLLATCFILLSFVIYIARRNDLISLIFCPIFFGLALGSKELAIAYPGLLICYEIYSAYQNNDRQNNFSQVRNQTGFKRVFIKVGIYIALILSYFGLRYLSIGVFIGGYGNGDQFQFQFPETLINYGINFFQYLARTFLPPLGAMPLLWLCVGGLGVLIWRSRSQFIPRQIYLLSAFLFSGYFLFLFPVLNLSISLENTQEERFLYLPSVFAVIFLSISLLVILPKFTRRFWLGVVAVSLCFSISLFNSNQTWVDAAQIAESIIASLKEVNSSDRLYVVNLPDRYRGAYIFRNSFGRAMKLFLPGKFLAIQTIAFHNLDELDDRFMVLEKNQFKSLNPNLQFYFKNKGNILPAPARKQAGKQTEKIETAEFKIFDFSDRGFSFSLPNRQANDKVVFYTNQKLLEIR
jgi:protein O-mannosyl-transferase